MGEPPATSAHTSFPWATGSVCAARGHQRLRTRRPIPNLDSFRLSHACSCCPLRLAARVHRSPRARPAFQATSETPACKGPPPRGAPQVLRARRRVVVAARIRSERVPEVPARDLSSVRRGHLAALRCSLEAGFHVSLPPHPLLTLCRAQQAAVRSSAAIPELHARLTCVAIVSCDHVVSVV